MVAAGAMVEVFAAQPAASALLLDFDGSLAPIVVDPAAAAAPASTLALLDRLAPQLALVGIVSGRPVEFLAAAVPVARVELVGQYGLERRLDGSIVLDPEAAAFATAVEAAAGRAVRQWPDLLIERKGRVALTVHWRGLGDDAGDEIGTAVEHIGAELGLEAYRTRMACELRPPLGVDKGTGVRALLAAHPAVHHAVFAGDDRGDLAAFDAFDALHDIGVLATALRIGVRSPEMPGELMERADLVVDGPGGLAQWLGALADALDAR